ncbi:MAG TPA: hypothetical protein VFN10_04615 [Thermoanaerobaculia bacterium]|nr:hypothetical protein [Thermoanaerobaculia bacterium]
MTLLLVLSLFFAPSDDLTRMYEIAARIRYLQQTRGKVTLDASPVETARILGIDEATLAEYRIEATKTTFSIAKGDVVVSNDVQPPSDARELLTRYDNPVNAHADAARKTIAAMQAMAREIEEKHGSSGGDDEWGTPMLVEVNPDGNRYRIVSAGADRVFDPTSWSRPMDLDPASDLVYENGKFKRRLDVDRYLRESALR